MKKIALALLVLIALTGATSQAEETTHSDSQSKCPNGYVIVDIGGIKIKVPRLTMEYTRDRKIHFAERDCSLTTLIDPVSISTGVNGITIFRPSSLKRSSKNWPLTSYQQWEKLREEGMAKGKVDKLPDGVTKISWKGWELYILPFDKAPTANNEPVLLSCSGLGNQQKFSTQSCDVTYMHPDKLSFRYRFFRSKVAEEDYLQFDSEWRQYYESIKILKPSNDGEQ